MFDLMTLHALLVLGATPALDTVFAVTRGTRLDFEAGMGSARVEIRAWARDEVQIQTGAAVQVSRDGAVVRVRPASMRMGGGNVSYTVSVPAWMPIVANALQADMTVEGTSSDVSLTTVRGRLAVTGGEGRISLKSVEGAVSVNDSRGEIEAWGANSNVRVSGATGRVSAESVNGNVVVERTRTTELQASTVNGRVTFDGPIEAGGRYRLTSHNGGVSLGVQEGANVTLQIQTYNGEFRSAFPVTITGGMSDRRFTLVLGSGSASVEASSFNGDIELRRPGAP